MSLNELLLRVRASRKRQTVKTRSKSEEEVTADDILRAIDKLNKLGGGLRAIPNGKNFIIQSVASELR